MTTRELKEQLQEDTISYLENFVEPEELDILCQKIVDRVNEFEVQNASKVKDIDTEELKNELVRRGYIRAFWMHDDIVVHSEGMGVALTDEDVIEIAEMIERYHDANVGINWDVIQSYIHQHQSINKNK